MKQTTISAINANQRIDKFIRKWLPEAPLSFLYRLFRKKDVKVNGHWVSIDYVVNIGDEIKIYVTDEQMEQFSKPKTITAAPFPHPIIYEDEVCLIVYKPKGLLVHGDETETRVTLSYQVLGYLAGQGYSFANDQGYVPGPAHRLDRNTSGLVIFGKTLAAQQVFESLFHDRSGINKTYLALVVGDVQSGGVIDLELKKDEERNLVRVSSKEAGGLKAITHYTVIERFGDYTLLEVKLMTGRTHQIRVHMQAIGHPIVGDRKYGQFEVNKLMLKQYRYEHQFLHAYKLEFAQVPSPIAHLSNHTYTASLGTEEEQLLESIRK